MTLRNLKTLLFKKNIRIVQSFENFCVYKIKTNLSEKCLFDRLQ